VNFTTKACLPNAGRGGRYIGPNPLGLQLFGLAGSNTATRWPVNWHLWLPHHRARLFDEAFRLLEPSLPASITRCARWLAAGTAACCAGGSCRAARPRSWLAHLAAAGPHLHVMAL
jgi:hypothetical protein